MRPIRNSRTKGSRAHLPPSWHAGPCLRVRVDGRVKCQCEQAVHGVCAGHLPAPSVPRAARGLRGVCVGPGAEVQGPTDWARGVWTRSRLGRCGPGRHTSGSGGAFGECPSHRVRGPRAAACPAGAGACPGRVLSAGAGPAGWRARGARRGQIRRGGGGPAAHARCIVLTENAVGFESGGGGAERVPPADGEADPLQVSARRPRRAGVCVPRPARLRPRPGPGCRCRVRPGARAAPRPPRPAPGLRAAAHVPSRLPPPEVWRRWPGSGWHLGLGAGGRSQSRGSGTAKNAPGLEGAGSHLDSGCLRLGSGMAPGLGRGVAPEFLGVASVVGMGASPGVGDHGTRPG